MNDRLKGIIKYKTGGKKIQFAKMVGWTPQYLSKLLKGENFGMQPILTILEKFPEINARWFLFGTGEMLEIRKLFDLQHDTMMYIQSILDIDKYIPYMSGEEIHEFEDAVKTG
jgi:transcriptional regulator with XRE-family HTH domain